MILNGVELLWFAPQWALSENTPPKKRGIDSIMPEQESNTVSTSQQATVDDSEQSTAVDAEKQADKEVGDTAEHGGPAGPEPTRYGDWEKGGRCIDF